MEQLNEILIFGDRLSFKIRRMKQMMFFSGIKMKNLNNTLIVV